ncbi:unnamed protein product [Sphagnum tenellum]
MSGSDGEETNVIDAATLQKRKQKRTQDWTTLKMRTRPMKKMQRLVMMNTKSGGNTPKFSGSGKKMSKRLAKRLEAEAQRARDKADQEEQRKLRKLASSAASHEAPEERSGKGRIIPVLLIEPMESMAAAMEVVEVAVHDPTLNKVRELQQKLAGGDTLSPHDFQVMMLEMRKLHDDVEDAKHGVILRGVGNLGGERGEFANDVKEFGHRLLAKLEVDSAVSVSCRRLPASKLMVEKARSQGRSVRAPILMKFGSVAGEYEMFKALRNLNKIEESSGWRFDHEIPYALKGRWSILEAEAYKIRKEQAGTKTRLVWKGIDLELHAKKDREQSFIKINI